MQKLFSNIETKTRIPYRTAFNETLKSKLLLSYIYILYIYTHVKQTFTGQNLNELAL